MVDGYHPPPSVGHDLGIMFGFMAFFALAMCVYLILWKAGNRRSEAREIARREALAQRGFGGEKSAGDNPGRSGGEKSGGDPDITVLAGHGGDGELVSGGAGRG